MFQVQGRNPADVVSGCLGDGTTRTGHVGAIPKQGLTSVTVYGVQYQIPPSSVFFGKPSCKWSMSGEKLALRILLLSDLVP